MLRILTKHTELEKLFRAWIAQAKGGGGRSHGRIAAVGASGADVQIFRPPSWIE